MKKRNIYKALPWIIVLFVMSLLITSAEGKTNLNKTQSQIDQILKKPQNLFLIKNNEQEYINPFQGNLNITSHDISLKGINGMDLQLDRIYNSAESNLSQYYERTEFQPDDEIFNFSTDNPNETFYNIGAGWSFNIPYMRMLQDQKTFEFNLGREGSLIVTGFGDKASKRKTEFLDNKEKGIEVYFLSDESYRTESFKAWYLVEDKLGNKYYFAKEGMLLGQQDKYGNEIKYFYSVDTPKNDIIASNASDATVEYPHGKRYLLKKIIDSAGRNIEFNRSDKKLDIVVKSDSSTKKVTYNFKKVVDATEIRIKEPSYSRLLDSSDIVLDSVVNEIGEETLFNYDFQLTRYSYEGKSLEGMPKTHMVALLKSIKRPGGSITQYEYSNAIKNCGLGCVDFFKITRRCDVNTGNLVSNEKLYRYTMGADVEFDGFPKYGTTKLGNVIEKPHDFKYVVTVEDLKGNISEYTANKRMSVINEKQVTPEKCTEIIREYDDKEMLKSCTTKTTSLKSIEAVDPFEVVENYEYECAKQSLAVSAAESAAKEKASHHPYTVDLRAWE